MAARLSQFQLADRAQLSKTSISAIEGGRQNITFETAASLAKAAGTTVIGLLSGTAPTASSDTLAIELPTGPAFELASMAAKRLGRDVSLLDPVTRAVRGIATDPSSNAD